VPAGAVVAAEQPHRFFRMRYAARAPAIDQKA
jgi:hypothetical protein